MMPHLDGWELLARVLEHSPVLPIIVMSAVNQSAARRYGVTTDHTLFLPKPFDLETVLATGERLIGVPRD